ncbi:tetraspanin-18-like isoform X2 [Telopea speciosissima]|uniref:tetraspanin-18-like isoform X2 n=1 Tax=Telopea speciosissima TaxID=54955 RepID=UPI001CC450E2|nr:tetraspanin-18-like isoform X2 [Telopea speciosissima]
MRSNHCRSCLAFLLKFLNFLQTFVGVSIIIYAIWMLNQWKKHARIPQPTAPSPESLLRVPGDDLPLNLLVNMVSGLEDGLVYAFRNLPSPWFIYTFLGIGIILCSITCIGHIAAEVVSGCCLCFYTLLTTILMILEAALVAFVTFDHQWEKDLPSDPTGELASFRAFIEENFYICKWVGITVVIIQALSLLLAMILRVMVATRRGEDDSSDDDYTIIRGGTLAPLLNPYSIQTRGSTSTDSKTVHSDIWSTRMREKFSTYPMDLHSEG